MESSLDEMLEVGYEEVSIADSYDMTNHSIHTVFVRVMVLFYQSP